MTRITTVSALALIAMAGPSFADITPQQVWDDLESYMTGFGYEVTATEEMSGDVLTVSEISFTITVPEDDVVVTFDLPDLTYTDKGDGSVDVTIPPSMPLTVAFGDVGAAPNGSVDMLLTQSDMVMNVSGTAEAMTYTYAAESIGLEIVGLKDGDEALPEGVLRGALRLGPLAGSSEMTLADGLRTIAQDMNYGDVSYDFAFDDPEDPDTKGMLKGTLRGLAGAGASTLPEGVDFSADPAEAIAAGFTVDGTVTHTGGETQFSFQEGTDVVTGQLSSSGGEIGVAMSEASMTYALSAMGQTVSMMVPDMPFPIEGAFGEAGIAFEMPLAPSDTPVPANLSILLADFTMADMLWGIFDPGQVLPRDPATVGASLEAMVTPFVSLLDQEALARVEMEGEVPGELNSAKLTDLVVRAIGAEVTGAGDFTFDNSDLESFDGMPRPEGKLDLQISGVNGVIDKLIEMGLVQEQDAMGARMMLGMFSVPGAAPDTASSTIEINAQGHILANGQRIK